MRSVRELLKDYLSERMSTRPSYSLRAFARDLKVSPQQLSNVLNGRKGISPETAETMAKRLGLEGKEKELFCQKARAEFSRSKTDRMIARSNLSHLEAQNENSVTLQLDMFKIVSNWHHFALVELLKITPKFDARAIAKRLGISENELNLSLARLERLELVVKTENGWKANQKVMIADQGIPTEAVKKFHRQVTERALQAMTFQKPNERYSSSSTIPIKVKSVDRAKELIREFRDKLTGEISDIETGEEIYGLSVHFFRLTETKEETL